MRDACSYVNFEQPMVEPETPIELNEARIRFALEPSAPEIPVRFVTHKFITRIQGRIVP